MTYIPLTGLMLLVQSLAGGQRLAGGSGDPTSWRKALRVEDGSGGDGAMEDRAAPTREEGVSAPAHGRGEGQARNANW